MVNKSKAAYDYICELLAGAFDESERQGMSAVPVVSTLIMAAASFASGTNCPAPHFFSMCSEAWNAVAPIDKRVEIHNIDLTKESIS